MAIIAQTPRFTIREFLPREEKLFVELLSDERVTPYLPQRSSDENRKIFRETIADHENQIKLTRWGIFNNDGQYLGFCMLKNTTNDPKIAELGYVIHPDFKGTGIATEAAIVLINYGFKELNLKEIFAVTVPANTASQNVLAKAGMMPGSNMVRNGIWLSYFKIEAKP